ncbi:MAG TPA: CocE/NonD family hydrolase [Acidimicrobiales bacterium]|nr:CocE/NonD family hydrolase [Acidimicrobiales bacterium]
MAVAAAVAAIAGTPAAWATTPSPPPGAPAVESAPSSLTGLTPELPPDVIAASAAPGSTWTPEAATYGTAVENDVVVKSTTDGAALRVNVIRPANPDGTPAAGPFPVLLTMTPYGKGTAAASAPGSAAQPGGGSPTGGEDAYLVERGYIEVVMDVRGTGDSEGTWGLFDPVQQQDAIDVVNWAVNPADLPGSDGKVGTFGPSYLGINQLLLAGAEPKGSPLKAIFPVVAANDLYADTSFMGGLLDFEFDEAYLGITAEGNTANPVTDTTSDSALLGDLATIEADHATGLASYHAASTANILSGGDEAYDSNAAAPADRGYWGARSPRDVLANVVANGIPAYLVGGEFDIFQNGEPANYAALQNLYAGRPAGAPMAPGQPTTGRYQLIDGPWEHLNGSSVDVDPLELEWFDTWLKGEATGMADTPTPLHYYDLGSGTFDETSTYPFAGSAPHTYYFGPGGTLTDAAPTQASAGSDTIAFSQAGSPCGRPVDQWSMGGVSIAASEAGVLAPCTESDGTVPGPAYSTTYTTAPFATAQTVAGPITATIDASATTTDTQWVVEVEEVTPDGTSFPLTEGALLGSLRATDPTQSWTQQGTTVLPWHPYTAASRAPVVPGQTTQYQVQVFPTLATIAAGDALRVTVSTADTPHLTPLPGDLTNLEGGVYTIDRGPAAPSSLTVDLDPALTPAGPPPGLPEAPTAGLLGLALAGAGALVLGGRARRAGGR